MASLRDRLEGTDKDTKKAPANKGNPNWFTQDTVAGGLKQLAGFAWDGTKTAARFMGPDTEAWGRLMPRGEKASLSDWASAGLDIATFVPGVGLVGKAAGKGALRLGGSAVRDVRGARDIGRAEAAAKAAREDFAKVAGRSWDDISSKARSTTAKSPRGQAAGAVRDAESALAQTVRNNIRHPDEMKTLSQRLFGNRYNSRVSTPNALGRATEKALMRGATSPWTRRLTQGDNLVADTLFGNAGGLVGSITSNKATPMMLKLGAVGARDGYGEIKQYMDRLEEKSGSKDKKDKADKNVTAEKLLKGAKYDDATNTVSIKMPDGSYSPPINGDLAYQILTIDGPAKLQQLLLQQT